MTRLYIRKIITQDSGSNQPPFSNSNLSDNLTGLLSILGSAILNSEQNNSLNLNSIFTLLNSLISAYDARKSPIDNILTILMFMQKYNIPFNG